MKGLVSTEYSNVQDAHASRYRRAHALSRFMRLSKSVWVLVLPSMTLNATPEVLTRSIAIASLRADVNSGNSNPWPCCHEKLRNDGAIAFLS